MPSRGPALSRLATLATLSREGRGFLVPRPA